VQSHLWLLTWTNPRFSIASSLYAPQTALLSQCSLSQGRQSKKHNVTKMNIASSDLGGSLLSSCQSLSLDLPPSCLAFCPAHPAYFVVGTYYLETQIGQDDERKASQSRNGSLIVFRLADNGVYVRVPN
jgi:hypothetical protein